MIRREFRPIPLLGQPTDPGLNAVKMLFWSAVINGLLAPPLIQLETAHCAIIVNRSW